MMDFLVEVGSKVLAASAILIIRYIEKSAIIKHYRKKFDRLLDEKFDKDENI